MERSRWKFLTYVPCPPLFRAFTALTCALCTRYFTVQHSEGSTIFDNEGRLCFAFLCCVVLCLARGPVTGLILVCFKTTVHRGSLSIKRISS